MADEDPDDKLALPKIGFRRRKRDAEPVAQAPAEETTVEQAPVDEAPVDEAPVDEAPVDEAPTEVIPQAEPQPEKTAEAEEPEEHRPTELFADEPDEADPVEDERPTEVLAATAPPAVTHAEPAKPPKQKRERSLPHVDPRAAAVFTGIVAGLVGVGLTYGFQKGCEAIRSTGSCGGAGLPLLIVVLIAMTFAGSALLKAFGVPDTLSTSFLGVGLLAVLVLLFALDYVDRWWMVIVIPLVAAVTYLISWWASAKFGADTAAPAAVEDAREKVEQD